MNKSDIIKAAELAKKRGQFYKSDVFQAAEINNYMQALIAAAELLKQVEVVEAGSEPMVGDLISIDDGKSASIATHVEFLEQLKVMERHFAAPLKIIQRAGKPVITRGKV